MASSLRERCPGEDATGCVIPNHHKLDNRNCVLSTYTGMRTALSTTVCG